MTCAIKLNLTGCEKYLKGTTFNPIILRLTEPGSGNLIDITGWSGQSQVRGRNNPEVYVDGVVQFLQPNIVVVRFKEEDLDELEEEGLVYNWNLILENEIGERDEFFAGLFEVRSGATQWQK
jgi:hypothetical protein